MHFDARIKALFLICLLALPLHAAQPESKPLKYPEDLREFRRKAVDHDGAMTPDIAFTLRSCRACKNLYVFGNFPRLKRTPFDSLAQVHETMQSVVEKAPPKSIFSAKAGRVMPRACPICNEPEGASETTLPDKAVFFHLILETGADLQIDYDVKNGKAGKPSYWLIPGAIKGKTEPAQKVDLADEKESTIKKAIGAHFSLRSVWDDVLNQNVANDKVYFESISPGLFFVYRSPKVPDGEFTDFGDKLKVERNAGKFSKLDTPLKVDPKMPTPYGTVQDWLAPKAKALAAGEGGELFVAISYPELRKIAAEILTTRGMTLELNTLPGAINAGTGSICKIPYKMELNFGPLASHAVVGGLSLHHACSLFLSNPIFSIDNGVRLDEALRKRYPRCNFEVIDGRFLILTDSKGETRRVDVMGLADKLDPENAFLFDIFCAVMLSFDAKKDAFNAKPPARDISPTGLPAFIERRVRPSGFLLAQNKPAALFEPREDAEGKRFEICYTSECSASIVYIDPSKERFAGLTIEEVQKIYDITGGILPMILEGTDSLNFPGELRALTGPCKVQLVYGLDISSLACEPGRAWNLALTAGFSGEEERLHMYAYTSNCAALSPRRLTTDELNIVNSRTRSLLQERTVDPGQELALRFEFARAEPKGKLIKRAR